jgi:hypothetical protein
VADSLPPLPPGFVLDSDTSGVPPLPPGFELEGEMPVPGVDPQQAAIDQYDSSTTMLERAGNDLKRGGLRAAQTLASLMTGESAMRAAGVPGEQIPSERDFEAGQILNVAGLQGEINAVPRRPVTEQIGGARSFGEIMDAFGRDPAGAIAGFGFESLPQAAPGLVAGALSGPLGMAGVTGASSYLTERQGGILEYLAEQGVNIADEKALAAAVSDPALMDAARQYGQTRGAIIAPIDAATAGLAGRVLAPSGVTGPIAKQLINIPAQTAVQGAAGGGAEALAQVATTGEVGKPGEVAAEIIGEAFSAPGEVLSGGREAYQQTRADAAAARAQEAQAGLPPLPPGFEIEPAPVTNASGQPEPPAATIDPLPEPPVPAAAPAGTPTPAPTQAPLPPEATQPATPPEPAPVAEPPPATAAAPAPAAAPSPNAQRVQGARGTQVETEYEVVDMATLQRAGGDLQPRNRATDGSYEAQIARNSGEAFNPEFLGRSAEASTGAPIIGEDNVIESGNGRFQILDRVYTQNPEGAAKYRQMIEAQGFKTEGIERPILVRRRRSAMTPEQRASWVNEANESTMASLSADERARMDSKEITNDLLARYNPEADLSSAQNRGFLAEFVRRVGADPRAFFSQDGVLTQDGLVRAQRAMLSAGFGGSPAADKIVADIVSNTDPEVGTQLANLMVATAPQFAELKARVAEGKANPAAATLGERVAEAVQWINKQRRAGENPVAMLAQGDLLSGGVDPTVAEVVRQFLKPDGKSIQTKKYLTDFIRFLQEEIRSESQPTPQEAASVAGQRAQGTFVPATQGGLFDPPPGPPSSSASSGPARGSEERRPGGAQGNNQAAQGNNGPAGVDPDSELSPWEAANIRQSPKGGPPILPVGRPATEMMSRAYLALREKVQQYEAGLLERVRIGVGGDNLDIGLGPDGRPQVFDRNYGEVVPLDGISEDGRAALDELFARDALQREEGGDADGEYVGGDDELAFDRVEDARRKKVRKSKKQPGPFAQKREGLIGTSTREDIWTEAGVDPDEARLWPIERQFAEAAKLVKQKFGFPSIDRDNTLNVIEAVDVLKDAYVSLQNMVAVLGMNPKVASINGTVGLELKRKMGGARAYFQPTASGGKIGMVRKNDSFSHEWGHALDWHMVLSQAVQLKTDKGAWGVTGLVRKFGATNPADPVASAWVDLLNAMFYDEARLDQYRNDLDSKLRAAKTPKQKAAIQKIIDGIDSGRRSPKAPDSTYYAKAKKGDGGAGEGGYLQKPTEMLARAFEAFIAMKVEQAGAFDTNFITARDYMYRGEAFDGFAGVYPEAAERVAIFEAIEGLVAALQRQQALGPDMANDVPTVVAAPPKYWQDALPNAPRSWWQRAQSRANSIRHNEMAAANRAKAQAEIREGVVRNMAGPNATAAGRILSSVRLASQNARAAWAIQVATFINDLGQRYPEASSIRRLRQWFATNPGESIAGLNQGKFKERWKPESRRLQTRLGMIVDAFQLNEWDADQTRNLRDVLVGVAAPASETVRQAAARFRQMYDDLYNYGTRAGLNFGYTKNGYLTRLTDETQVAKDPGKFRRKATELYKIVFDRDWPVNEALDPESPGHTSLMSFARQYMNPMIEPVYDDVRALKKVLSRLEVKRKAMQARGEDTTAVDGQIAAGLQRFEEKIRELHDLVKPLWAEDAANDWYNAIMGINRAHHEWEARAPSGSFMKSRTLPPEADAIMGDFYITDPIALTSTYISQIVRRSAFAEFFGKAEGSKPIGWKLDEALADMVADGVTDDDRAEVIKSVDLMVGRNRTVLTNRGLRMASNLNTWFTPVFLTASLIPSLPEIVSVVRQTGRVRDAFKAMGMQMRELAVSLTDYMPKDAQERVRWARQFSELLGVTSSSLTDEIVAARVNLLYQTPAQQQRMARAMQDNLIHPLTMSQRRAVAMIATQALGRAVKEFRSGDAKRGADYLGEFGVEVKDRQLQDLILSLEGAPSMQELEAHPAFLRLQSAVNRFVDQAIQDPGVEDKPRLASAPEFAHMYGLLSYLSSFQRNIVEPTAKLLGRSWNDKNASLLHRALTPVLLIGVTQMAARMLSYLVTGRGDSEDLEKYLESEGPFGMPNWFFMFLSSSGAFGVYDPILQAVASTKYNKPVSNIMLGPSLGAAASVVEAGISLTSDRNSPNTTSAEYRATQRAWDYIVAPAVMNAWLRNPYTAMLPQPLPWLAGVYITKSGVGPIDGPRQVAPEVMGFEKPKPRKE